MYDEPTAGLDPVASTVVEDLIRSLHVNKVPNSELSLRAHLGRSRRAGMHVSCWSAKLRSLVAVADRVSVRPVSGFSADAWGVLALQDGDAESSGGISSYIVVTHQHSTILRSVDRCALASAAHAADAERCGAGQSLLLCQQLWVTGQLSRLLCCAHAG